MSLTNNPDVVVIDASVMVSIAAKEAATYEAVKAALDYYTENGSGFFAPNVAVSEVIYAFCKKQNAGDLTELQHSNAIKSFLDLIRNISMPADDTTLLIPAIEILKTYGCSHSSDSLYIALAKSLAEDGTVELFTLDQGMKKQAAKNAPSVVVNVLQ